MKTRKISLDPQGSALVLALITTAVLGSLAGTAFLVVQNKSRVVHQAASWKEALLTAEGGVEMAMTEIRRDLLQPGTAWDGWDRSADPLVGEVEDPGIGGSSSMTYSLSSRALLRKGEGGQRSWAEVSVDAPLCLKDRTGEQWYRIRSRGVAEISGGARASGDKQDRQLRRYNMLRDSRTGKALARPQATRTIEAIAKPVGAFRLALFGLSTVNLTSQNVLVDSYDSRDSTKSTNGRYDALKRQENGDIATNGQLLEAGGAQVHGDAMTNGGTVLNSNNVTGEIRTDFFQEVFLVTKPDTEPDPFTPSAINGTTTILAKPGTPSSYQFSTINMAGSNTLHIQGAEDGSPTYCQIVVTGDIKLSGQAQITQGPNVFVRIFLVGDGDITGNGIANPNSPLHFQLYGCDRPKNPDGTPASTGNLKIAGNGGLCGSVYAPNYAVEVKGGGNSDNLFGAIVGKTVLMNGVTSIHYDEALADGGLISDFKIVSWFEDER